MLRYFLIKKFSAQKYVRSSYIAKIQYIFAQVNFGLFAIIASIAIFAGIVIMARIAIIASIAIIAGIANLQ